MRGVVRASTVAVAWLVAAAACGDPVVILGDLPGIMRVVAGRVDDLPPEQRAAAHDVDLASPRGLAVDADGTLYVAEHRAARILAVRPNGDLDVVVDHAGCSAAACLRRPAALALAPDGTLVVADAQARRVFRISTGARSEVTVVAGDPDGTEPGDGVQAAVARLEEPSGVAVAPDGTVYFSDWPAHRVWRVGRDGSLAAVAGTGRIGSGGDGGPAVAASLRVPRGLAVAEGRLYVADAGDHRVRVVDLATGIVSTAAGVGTQGFAGDGGRATSALLSLPEAVAVTADGATLFVADRGNGRLRAVDLDTRIMRTFAGNGADTYGGSGLEAGETALPGPAGVAAGLGFLFVSDDRLHLVWRTPIRL